jgi:hypothetical protein
MPYLQRNIAHGRDGSAKIIAIAPRQTAQKIKRKLKTSALFSP